MKQGWEIKKLGEVCAFCSGYTPKESELLECGAVPYFKVSDMNHCDNLKYLTHTSLFLEDGCKVYPKHTIVFPKNGAAIATNKKRILAQDSVVDLNTGGVVANDALVYFEYLYLYFLNLDFRLHTRRGAVPTLDIAELKNKSIPIPSREEQERIVAELDCLSGVIEKKKQQLKELDALAQSIFYQIFGDPTNSKYETRKLSNLSEYKLSYGSGASAVDFNGDVRYVRITDIKEDGELQEEKVSPSIIEDKYILNDGDILFARSGATVGKTYLYKNKEGKALYAGYLIRFIPNRNIVIPAYIYAYTKTNYYKSFISVSAQAVAQPNINAQQYSSLTVPVPPLALQQEFADKIEAIERQKELIKQSIAQTEELFNSRMDYYFN